MTRADVGDIDVPCRVDAAAIEEQATRIARGDHEERRDRRRSEAELRCEKSGLVPRPVQTVQMLMLVLVLAEDRQGVRSSVPSTIAERCDGLGEAEEGLDVTPAKIARRCREPAGERASAGENRASTKRKDKG